MKSLSTVPFVKHHPTFQRKVVKIRGSDKRLNFKDHLKLATLTGLEKSEGKKYLSLRKKEEASLKETSSLFLLFLLCLVCLSKNDKLRFDSGGEKILLTKNKNGNIILRNMALSKGKGNLYFPLEKDNQRIIFDKQDILQV